MKEGRLMIEIKNLTIPFVDKQINMTISKGYNLLVGDNGVGKTLLLDYISGLKKTKEIVFLGMKKSFTLINIFIFRIVYQEWIF